MVSPHRRRALITGSSRGIGLAIATSLAEEGYDIVLHGRTITPALTELATSLTGKHGISAIAIAADLTDMAQAKGLFDQVTGTVDVLVNNAGLESMAPLENQLEDDWMRTLMINLHAPVALSQQFARRLINAQGSGVIINISSIHGTIPRTGFAAYSIAKAGLDMLSRSAALEWAEHGIRVVTVSPGAIETDINSDAIDKIGRENFADWIPAARIGVVQEVAEVVAFLASKKAAYITGTSITVDGGYSQALVQYDSRNLDALD